MKANNKPVFWVSNISNRNVTLTDLALNIKAYSTVNLLDEKHYSLNIDQLNRSKNSGSIFKKRDKIRVRVVPPPAIEKEKIAFLPDGTIPSRERSILNLKMEEYEELKVDDKKTQRELEEQLASDNADLELNEPEAIKKVK